MITLVKEIAVKEMSVTANKKGVEQFTARRSFVVRSDNASDDENTVRQAAGVPKIGNQHSLTVAGLRCQRVRPRLTEPLTWHVDCDYGTHGVSWPEAGVIQEPLGRASIVRWSSADEQIYDPRDAFNRLYADSAGTPFDTPPPADDGILICTITRNEALFDAQVYTNYIKAVNDTFWYGWPRARCKMQRMQGDPMFEQTYYYYQVTYEIWIRRRPWEPVAVLDRGPYELDDAGTPVLQSDGNNQPTGRSDLLDGHGKRLGMQAAPEFLSFDQHITQDFGALNLP